MPVLLGFMMPGPLELIIILAVLLLLFGNRLPSVMRSMGRGVTEFKKGIKGDDDDIEGAGAGAGKSDKEKAGD